jgi:peptide/nickel transport system permease protein
VTAFLIRRLLNLIPTFLLATFLAFLIIDLAPGDFASQFAWDAVDLQKEQRIRAQLGLDQPMIIRYFKWLQNLVLHGDFGTSMVSKGDVTLRVIPRMINSMTLVLPSLVLIYLIAIPIGVFSALRKYSFGDRSLTVFSLVGLAIPNFFMALIVLALIVQWYRHFGWFLLPTGGMTSTNYSSMTNIQQFFDVLWHMAAPLLIIVLTGLAGLSRVMRGQMLDVMSQDYIRTAQAKGLSDRTVTYKHAVRNAVLPIVATIGAGVTTALLGGGTVEFVMGWPGLTPLFIGSVYAKDVYVLMAILTIGTMLVMLGNLISDVLLALIDPRIRY